jgi:ATP-dependent RNA helicase DeaD
LLNQEESEFCGSRYNFTFMEEIKTFEELGVCAPILRAIEELGYEQPMPIQAQVIPVILGTSGDGLARDVVGLAQTGTGKTAAFGLPVLQSVDLARREPQALILAPTRELCLQIAGDLQDYAKYLDHISILPVYGGSSIGSQISALRRGVHVIVATPGRLIDLMNRGAVSLEAINTLVMDEADEMLSMGFTDDIETILAGVPAEHRTMLFSATMPKQIASIAQNYMTNPVEVTIGHKNEGSANVSHVYYLVHARDKYAALKRIVDFYPSIYGIIFCRTRQDTQEIAAQLMADGYNADALHGDLSQQQRDTVMNKFRMHNLQLLVATDVAARGLDVDNLTHVINYGLPDDIEVYTHRSGRTGRAGKRGTSICIIHIKERRRLHDIERVIGKAFEKGLVPTAKQITEKQLFHLADRLEKVEVKEDEISQYLDPIYKKLSWLSTEDLIKRVVSLEFNRMIEYYKDSAELDIPEERTRRERLQSAERSERRSGSDRQDHTPEPGFKRIFINVGRRDGINPRAIITLLNANVHHRIEVGRIDLATNCSFFEVPEAEARFVLKDMEGADYRGRRISVSEAGAEPRKGAATGGRRSYERKFGDNNFKSGSNERKSNYGHKKSGKY